MNYDPIHDTYSASSEVKVEPQAPDLSASSGLPPVPHHGPGFDPVASTPDRVNTETVGDRNAQFLASSSGAYENHGELPSALSKVSVDNLVASLAKLPPESRGDVSENGDSFFQRTELDFDSPDSDLEYIPGHVPSNFLHVSTGFKHLKKKDGEPFWRKDIQHDFLEELFSDDHRVFTNNFPWCEVPNAANGPKLTFAELYVRTLAESLKSSRVLRERLIKDSEMGISVSKVCLLVNAGRMNTTVNFVPDMRSALRTYHLIPSLQADPTGPSKPLQDTPRLKTILKAVCDDQCHLQTLIHLLKTPPEAKPNTNVIKIIFLMSTFFQQIPYHYDSEFDLDTFLEKLRLVKLPAGPQNKFLEFFLNDEIHPKNRARRFLWLMYTYLETSFTAEELEKNPFNPRVIPPLEYIPDAELKNFDIDTDFEIEYAKKMYHTRMTHLHEEINNTNPKRGNRSKRERQKIRSQLILEHSFKTGEELPEELLMADKDLDNTLGGEQSFIDEKDTEMADVVEEAIKAPPRVLNDRAKRKKPTPSVGSLVDDSKRSTDTDSNWINIDFPIPNLSALTKKYAAFTKKIPVKSLERDCPLALLQKIALAEKTKSLLSQVIKKYPDFAGKREETMQWINRYFQYKKSDAPGLVGLEWEDIRSDLVNGIETYTYQQLGKNLMAQDDVLDDGPLDKLEGEAPRGGYSQLESQIGDAISGEIMDVDESNAAFSPTHDLDKANEKSRYELHMLLIILELIEQNELTKRPKTCQISFDLDNETLLFK